MDNTVIVFDVDRCHIELNCPYFILNMTLAKLKKIFVLMCTQSYRNTEAIAKTEQYIDLCIEQAHEAWHEASVDFQNKYIDTKFHYEMSMYEKKNAERDNKKMFNTVKNKKNAYDRLNKVKGTFIEIKNKYSV